MGEWMEVIYKKGRLPPGYLEDGGLQSLPQLIPTFISD
jgi:hypothetical protein